MANQFKVLILNKISPIGLKRLPAERYIIGKDVTTPDAVLVRSADMHKLDIPASVKAIGRAGAGTNNIPVKAMSARGVPVFNAPGAIANANVPNMLGQISTVMAKAGLNIHNMINKSKGEVAYTLVDVDSQVPQQVVDLIAAIPGVLAVRYLPLEP